ncbi:MAG: hypothetical protein V4609_19565 [Pseudomonadota bacterium]
MQGLRSLFCCGSRARQRAAEPVDVDVSEAREDAPRPHGPPPAPPPAEIELIDGLDESMDDGLFMGAAFRNQTASVSQGDPETPPPPIDEDIEDVPPAPPGGRWRTWVNCNDAGVQAAFRDTLSVTLSGGLALLMRAAALMLAAQSKNAARAVGTVAGFGAVGLLGFFWPHAVKLILAPTSLRESACAKGILTALPFLALASATLVATPNEDDNTKLKIAVIAAFRLLAALMRDTCTQTQSEAWGSLDLCTADGEGLTLEQIRQYQLLRAAVATAVYCTMGWFILNAGDDWLGEVLTGAMDGMKKDAQDGFPNPSWPFNERGESPTQYLARTSLPFNLADVASRYILGVVLEAFDGYNSGGLAPAAAALMLGLRARYKPGKGPAALCANWSRQDGKAAATWQRILNNTSMRMGLGMGTDNSTAVGLRAKSGTAWRIACRQATSILNGLTEVRSLLIERGTSARTLAELLHKAQADARAEAGSQEAQEEWDVARKADTLVHGMKSDPPRAQAPSPVELAQIEQRLHEQARHLAWSGAPPVKPVEEAPRVPRVAVNIGLYDSAMTLQPQPVQRLPRGRAAARSAH